MSHQLPDFKVENVMSTKAMKFTPSSARPEPGPEKFVSKLALPGIDPGASSWNFHRASRSATEVIKYVNIKYFTTNQILFNPYHNNIQANTQFIYIKYFVKAFKKPIYYGFLLENFS